MDGEGTDDQLLTDFVPIVLDILEVLRAPHLDKALILSKVFNKNYLLMG